jgi:methionyl-tRNA synthetase
VRPDNNQNLECSYIPRDALFIVTALFLQIVAETIQRVWDKGDIYRAEYEGLYCVACEEYKDEKELIGTEADGTGEKIVCPTHR